MTKPQIRLWGLAVLAGLVVFWFGVPFLLESVALHYLNGGSVPRSSTEAKAAAIRLSSEHLNATASPSLAFSISSATLEPLIAGAFKKFLRRNSR